MTVNRDKYVDEIREIRRRHVEETKHMTPEERRRKDREEVEAFRALFGKIGTVRRDAKDRKDHQVVNRDKYVDEIHEIRRRIMEETKDMTLEERTEYVRKGSEEFQRMVDKKRAERLAAK